MEACQLGEVEDEHVLMECEGLREVRGDLGEWWRREMGDEDFIRLVKGFGNIAKRTRKGVAGEGWKGVESV